MKVARMEKEKIGNLRFNQPKLIIQMFSSRKNLIQFFLPAQGKHFGVITKIITFIFMRSFPSPHKHVVITLILKKKTLFLPLLYVVRSKKL